MYLFVFMVTLTRLYIFKLSIFKFQFSTSREQCSQRGVYVGKYRQVELLSLRTMSRGVEGRGLVLLGCS